MALYFNQTHIYHYLYTKHSNMKKVKQYQTNDHIFVVEIDENKTIVEDENGNDRIDTVRKLNVVVSHKIENGTRIEAFWSSEDNRLIGDLEVCQDVIPNLIAIRDGNVELEDIVPS